MTKKNYSTITNKKRGMIFGYFITLICLFLISPVVPRALAFSDKTTPSSFISDLAFTGELMFKAYSGDAQAQFEFGVALLLYSEDMLAREEGRRLIQSAIDQGYVAQELAQGVIDYIGEMIELRERAQQGDAQAQFEFGMELLLSDDAGEVAEGEEWILKSVQQGYIEEDIAQNVIEGRKDLGKLLQEASDGDPEAQVSIGMILLSSDIPEEVEAGAEWIRTALKQEQITEEEANKLIENGKEVLDVAKKARDGDAQAQYEFGFFLLHIDEPETGIELIKKSAEQEYVEAEYQLGSLYYDGEYVEQNYSLAYEWLKKAADKNHAVALYELGVMYHKGQHVPEDDEQAFALYLKSANEGYGFAMANVGARYLEGRGVEQDIPTGMAWLKKGVKKGNPDSMAWLGHTYREGKFVPEDREQALYWYEQAAEFNDHVALFYLGYMNEDSNPEEAAKWYERSSEYGNPDAAFNLSVFYEQGIGVEQDDQKSLEYCKLAAARGAPKALYNLGYFHYSGKKGLKVDKAEALKWYRLAAEQGHVDAMDKVGHFYRLGEVVEKDEKMAISWYQRSADHNNANGYNLLGFMASPTDPQKAIEYYKKALELGSPAAAFNLGSYYQRRTKFPEDTKKAIKYYHLAAQKGHVLAQYKLARIYFDRGGDTNYKIAFKWFYKAAEQKNSNAQNMLGYMYETGAGIEKNYKNALAWYKKAAAQGDSYSKEAIKRLKNRNTKARRNKGSRTTSKNMIRNIQVVQNLPDKIIVEVEYNYKKGNESSAGIGAETFYKGKRQQTSYKPQHLMPGHRKVRVEVSLYYEGAPNHFKTDQISISIYSADTRKNIDRKKFSLIKDWYKVK